MTRFAALVTAALVLQSPLPHFDSNRAWEDLRQVVGIGPRPAGSAAIEATRKYIKAQLAAAGVASVDQSWDDETPAGPVRMTNIVATLPGARKERIIIAGHYDTKRYREFRFVGANDGGSSTALVLELARALKPRRNALTIELLFLDGEEAVGEWAGTDHTYGSRHYVEEAKKAGTLGAIKAFVLLDMIGDRDLRIKRDTNSTTWLTDLVWNAARRRDAAEHFVAESTAMEDDHLPFMAAGVPSVDLIDFEYPAWHTPEDMLDKLSARSLQIVGDVVLEAIPALEARFR